MSIKQIVLEPNHVY